MTENQNSKRYDLEDRTLAFARDVRAFVKSLKRTIANDDEKQETRRQELIQEATELMSIFGSILRKNE